MSAASTERDEQLSPVELPTWDRRWRRRLSLALGRLERGRCSAEQRLDGVRWAVAPGMWQLDHLRRTEEDILVEAVRTGLRILDAALDGVIHGPRRRGGSPPLAGAP